jgi:uncharacterized membrane protein YhiD involved in acid resistance
LILGSVAAVIGFIVLWGFRALENRVERYQIAELNLTVAEERLSARELRERLETARFRIRSLSVTNCIAERRKKFACEVLWPATRGTTEIPAVVAALEQLPGIEELAWRGFGSGPG